MRLDSVRARKQEESAIAFGLRVESLLDAEMPAPPPALGVAAGSRSGDYRLAVRVAPGQEDLARMIAARSANEVDIRVVAVEARTHIPTPQAGTAPWLNEARRPLEPGVAISPQGSGWVGTLGAIVRRRDGSRAILSNAHVLGAIGGVAEGTPILQPFGGAAIGISAEAVPLKVAGNLADAQLASLRRVDFVSRYTHASGPIRDVVEISPEDLGRPAVKIGRTTGVRRGVCSAVEVDRLGVSYGDAGVLAFDDQIEFVGENGRAFSAGGDSGSLILWEGGDPISHLFAGGRDLDNVDVTYGNRLSVVLRLLDVVLA